MDDLKNKVHYISVTCIIEKNGKYLICKRSDKEKAFPGKWCVPGGKIEMSDFSALPKDTSSHWLNVFEKVVAREVLEETSLSITKIGYVSSLVFIRPNGFSTIVVSMHASYVSGEVVLSDELVDFAWVDIQSAKNYDLIENIYEQICTVDSLHKK